MASWEVKLQHLQSYGEQMQAAGQEFDRAASDGASELTSLTQGMSMDARFTEAVGLRATAVRNAADLGDFTDDMADGIQSYGIAARISHETYDGTDVTAAEELGTVRQLLDKHSS